MRDYAVGLAHAVCGNPAIQPVTEILSVLRLDSTGSVISKELDVNAPLCRRQSSGVQLRILKGREFQDAGCRIHDSGFVAHKVWRYISVSRCWHEPRSWDIFPLNLVHLLEFWSFGCCALNVTRGASKLQFLVRCWRHGAVSGSFRFMVLK